MPTRYKLHLVAQFVGYETISEWISRYECGGVEGLRVQAGRGRKPAFSPCASPTRR